MAIGISGLPRLGQPVPTSTATEQEVALTPDLAQYVAFQLPERAYLNAQGASYCIANTTGVTSVSAVPTTTTTFMLYNGESGANARTYVIDQIVAGQRVVDVTQSNSTELMFHLAKTTTTIPTQVACNHVRLSGSAQQGQATTGTLTKAILGGASTTLGSNFGWFDLPGQDEPAPTAVAGAVNKRINANVNGLILVPPGGNLALSAVQAAALASSMFWNVYYHEVVMVTQ